MILENRVAIVTGAGSGIGQAGALIMAGEGAFVVVADLNAASAAETVGRIEAPAAGLSALFSTSPTTRHSKPASLRSPNVTAG